MDANKGEIDETIEIILLINFSINEVPNLPCDVRNILNGNYEDVINNTISAFIIKERNNHDNLEEIIHKVMSETNAHHLWLYAGIASLLYFTQCNWTGPYVDEDIDWLKAERHKAFEKLSLYDECNINVQKPELLYLSKMIFSNIDLQLKYKSCIWWLLRANLLHQHILDENLGTIFEETENLILRIDSLSLLEDSLCKLLFNLEAARFYLCFRRIQDSEKYLDQAQNIANLTLTLQGAMGKRTKYQLEEKSQLYLKVVVNKNIFPTIDCEDTPISATLDDASRLEYIEFSEHIEETQLGAVEEAVILTKYTQLQICQPKHKLTREEISPYMTKVIENTKNWSLKMASLYYRCLLERDHFRTAERCLKQGFSLEKEYNNGKAPVARRIDLFFVSGMKPIWTLREEVACQMFHFDMVKAALEVYTKLGLWEKVITCYRRLDLNHKAAEIIQQELSKKPTVKLWCMLGDVTGDVSHYKTAWRLSGESSSRAQRQWGYHYFTRKHYVEAIPHLKLSVELNNIQEDAWFRLGYAALLIENWNLAATAYRRYCALEPSNFEAWNNLAKAYIKTGDLARARKSLEDAVKCDYDRWEVWDNFMVVNTDLGHFSEVIRCYHRILDLKGAHLDVQVLRILTDAIVNDISDANGNPASRLLPKSLELFGRLSVKMDNAHIWRMYAQLAVLKKTDVDDEKAAHYLQKAYRVATCDPHWSDNEDQTLYVLELCCDLAQAYLRCADPDAVNKKRKMLGSAKLSLQKVAKEVKKREWTHSSILEPLAKVEEYLTVVTNDLDEIKLI
ncbi:PREDICTED: tetratricopeptide repeat protein 27 [Dinoponera quadriceps]|uniref:Tetratricopeptide repeat protein 27 n=1 Tax=Dinoponera quadriceps TaxID=609295 RepID=A0A6P3XJD2_DINQU|nr:PREDICTED: tetratricopeptide repeat protein 27 [Dinoponera quadriceps]